MKTYKEDFKLRLVQLYNAGKSVESLSKEFEVSRPTLYSWIHKYNNGDKTKLENETLLSDSELEVIHLRKVLERSEMELDILKQAALIMGQKK